MRLYKLPPEETGMKGKPPATQVLLKCESFPNFFQMLKTSFIV